MESSILKFDINNVDLQHVLKHHGSVKKKNTKLFSEQLSTVGAWIILKDCDLLLVK